MHRLDYNLSSVYAMGEEVFVHKVSQCGLRRRPCRKLKGSKRPCSKGIPASLPSGSDETNLDIVMVSPAHPAADDAMTPQSSFTRRRSLKDRPSSSADSASIEKALRILKTIRALKEVVRVERASAIPEDVQKSAEVSGTWSCVLADSATRRHLVQSLTNDNHVTMSELNFDDSRETESSEATFTYYKAHEFQTCNTMCPQRCAVCQRLLWKISQPAMRCQLCGVVIHKQCYSTAMEGKCAPSRKMIPQAFGVDLTTAALLDEDKIPKVVRECVQAIESKGLADKNLYGVSGQMSDIMEIRDNYNQGENVDFSLYDDVRVITGLLKKYLRELPQPVITIDAYSQIMKATAAVGSMEGSDEDYTPLSNALKLLPKAHYLLLRYLGEHLHKVVDHSAENKVTEHDLAVIMAPTLMRAPGGNTTIFKDVHLQQYFVQCVIKKHEYLFS